MPSANDRTLCFQAVMSGNRPFNDIEWLAADANGAIAVFITAGFGPVPRSAFADVAEYDATLTWIHSLKIDIARSRSAPTHIYDYSPGTGSGFGWYVAGAPYRKVCVPGGTPPVLPPAIQTIAERMRFPSLDFSRTAQIVTENHFLDLNV